MVILLRASVFLWISGFLYSLQNSESCPGHAFPMPCEFVFGNFCFEFVEESKNWSQASSSCEKRGGELLNSSIKIFLRNINSRRNISNFTWWLGKGVPGESDYCTFMKLNPLQLITTPNCSQRRGFLCTHNLSSSSHTKKTIISSYATRSRLKRAINAVNTADIHELLRAAGEELRRMETTPGEPTNENRDSFIQNLLMGTKNLTAEFALNNSDILSHIINCSSGILLLSMTKCDIDDNPNPASLFEDVFEIFRTISMLLGLATTEEVIIKHSTGTIYQSSFKPADLSNVVLGSIANGEFIKLPSYSALKPQLGRHDRIVTQMATFSRNPHPSHKNVSGTVCSLLLNGGNADIKLKNLPELIEIFMPRPNATTYMNHSVVWQKNHSLTTSINISNPDVTVIFRVEPNSSVSLLLTLYQGSPSNRINSNVTATLSKTGDYLWMITPEMRQRTAGTWHIHIKVNSTVEEDVMLQIIFFASQCLYWDPEEETWSSEGCQVGILTTPVQTHCLCNHLTLFGSSFFVMPNHVDISRTAELFSTVSKNYVVLALLCAFFGLYFITLLWACYADRRSRSKRKLTLLEDNHPGALYNYLISFQTGHRKNAGTTANVTVKLTGSEGESCTHKLTDPDKPVFERGAVDMFLLATPFPLGEVRNLKLQHDNSGGHPSWYINKVIVQDLQARKVWHFLCNCWLSSDRGDAMTKKTFNVAKNNEITCFRNIFTNRTSTGFRDEHIWVSIVDPPSRSPFTRAQRVSCCMSLLLCTMAINIAFWNIPAQKDTPKFSLGLLEITWQEVMVGIQSGLLMFPINILIITIFRSIRPRVTSQSQKDKPEGKSNLHATDIPSILKDTEEVITLVSRSPRNKMSEMQSLVSTPDLFAALDRLHEFIQLMQGESESDPHWVYCSKFLLAALCHLLTSLEKLDPKNFQSPEEYHQLQNLMNLLVRKADMVFTSHLAYCPPSVTVKKKSASCWLPWWCVFLGWFLLLSISGVSTFFTLLYGLEYGKSTSIKWVMSLALSLFQSIFILQPLKVIGLAVFFALLLKPVAVEETEEVEQVLLEQQNKLRCYSGRDTL